MNARAPVSVSAGADLEVEGAVDLVFLGAMDTSEMLGTSSWSLIAAIHRGKGWRVYSQQQQVVCLASVTSLLLLLCKYCCSLWRNTADLLIAENFHT